MKWWQLLWLMHDNSEYLLSILKNPNWSRYHDWFERREAIRLQQRRTILDAIVEDELCIRALEGCQYRFVLEQDNLYGGFSSDVVNSLTAKETFLLVGGEPLVDAIDRGCAKLS